MATGWPIDEMDSIGDQSQTQTMLSDVSPIPIKNKPRRQHVAMCVQKLDFAIVADESRAEEDIDLDRKSIATMGLPMAMRAAQTNQPCLMLRTS